MRMKIFLSYHKKCEIIKSEILEPIQVGTEKSKDRLNMLTDNVGDNISVLNDRYCELTAQYWAWKNVEADCYGFMHYRRQFIFKEVPYCSDDGGLICYTKIDDRYKQEIGLDDETIRMCIDGYDLVLPNYVDTYNWVTVSNEVQFSSLDNLHARDFDIVCQTVLELYPQYEETVLEFRKGHYAYWYNMFIMKKEIFLEYSEWLFNILQTSEKKVDYSNYSQPERRTLAYMAERLLTIFVMKLLKDKPDIKIKNLKISFVKYTEPEIYEHIEELESEQKSITYKPYVDSVERAYREIQQINLPYSMQEVLGEDNQLIETMMKTKKIVFYGAGLWGKEFLSFFRKLGLCAPIEIWDRAAQPEQMLEGIFVVKPKCDLKIDNDDYLYIITLRNDKEAKKIRDMFYSIGAKNVILNNELKQFLARKLWEKVLND